MDIGKEIRRRQLIQRIHEFSDVEERDLDKLPIEILQDFLIDVLDEEIERLRSNKCHLN